jgi:hypothetical protein
MNALSLLIKKMHGFSIVQMNQILANVSAQDLDSLQYLLNFNYWEMDRAAKVLAERMVVVASDGMIPDDLNAQKHFAVSRPVVKVAHFVHRRLGVNPVVSKYGFSFAVLFSGAYLALNPIHYVPAFVWDGIAYTIHGLGAAPIAEAILTRFRSNF